MFRVLCERHTRDTPELATTHRVRDPNDRAAAEALRDGRIDGALGHLQRAGHLHVVDDDLAMYRHVLARWWDAHHEGHDHPLVDQRNTTRRQLNRLAHQLRQVSGEIGTDEIIASGDRRFSVGNRVTARTQPPPPHRRRPPRLRPKARRANRHMIIVPPEADLVARLDPELVSQLLRDDDLTLGADTVSHTNENDGSRMSCVGVAAITPATPPQ